MLIKKVVLSLRQLQDMVEKIINPSVLLGLVLTWSRTNGSIGALQLLFGVSMYRVLCQVLRMTVQLNVSYYGNKHDHSNVDTLMHTHICPIYLYDYTFKNLAYCPNKYHLTKQSF